MKLKGTELSEDDDFKGLDHKYKANETEPIENVGEESSDEPKASKRVKRHLVNPGTWKVTKCKENRQLWKEYIGRKKQGTGQYM